MDIIIKEEKIVVVFIQIHKRLNRLIKKNDVEIII